jgi:ribosomal protein L11
MEFCKRFNAQTGEQMGKILPVIISVYKDKTSISLSRRPGSYPAVRSVKTGSRQRLSGTKP